MSVCKIFTLQAQGSAFHLQNLYFKNDFRPKKDGALITPTLGWLEGKPD